MANKIAHFRGQNVDDFQPSSDPVEVELAAEFHRQQAEALADLSARERFALSNSHVSGEELEKKWQERQELRRRLSDYPGSYEEAYSPGREENSLDRDSLEPVSLKRSR